MSGKGDFSEKKARQLTFQYARNRDIIVLRLGSDGNRTHARALQEMDIFRPVCSFGSITLMGYAGKQMNTVKQDFYRVSSEAMGNGRASGGRRGRAVVLDFSIVRMQYLDIIC